MKNFIFSTGTSFFRRNFLISVAAVLLIMALVSRGSAHAEESPVELIADLNTPIPEGFGQFGSFSHLTSLGNDVDVAFVGTSHPQQAIYGYVDGSLVLIADATTPIPGGAGNFNSFGDLQPLGGGDFVFAGFGSGQEGIYAYVDGSLTVIADLNTPVPGGTGNFVQIMEFSVSSDGDIFFIGLGLSPQRGIYKFSNGSLSLIVNNETFANGFATFGDFRNPVPLGGGNVAFMGSVPAGEGGIYAVINGVLDFKVGFNTLYPGGTEPFAQIDSVVSLDGNIGFRGFSSAEQGGLLVIIEDSISVIADLSTTVPGGSETFSGFDPLVSLGGGNAVFRAGTQTQDGIYTYIAGALAKVADQSTPIPGGTGNFTSVFNPISMGGDDIAFTGQGSDFQFGVYTYIDGEIAVVADTGTPIPGGSGNFTSILNSGWLGGENLVLSGAGTGQSGIYTFIDGTIELVADLNTPVSGGAGHFTELSGVTTIGGNDLAFVGHIEARQEGIYTFIEGNIALAADLNTPIPGGDGSFTEFSTITSLGNDITFTARGASSQGIYTFIDGALAVLVDTNTPIPGGNGNFTGVGSPVLMEGGDIAFLGSGDESQSGIYAIIDGTVTVLVDTNTPLPGGTGNFTGQFHNLLSLGDGDIAFIFEASEQLGIYTCIDGVFSVVADTNTVIPGSTDTFDSLAYLSSIGGKNVTFAGWSDNMVGFYTYIDGALGVVADLNTPIPGGTGNFDGFDKPVSIGEGKVAFLGYGAEGQSGIFTFIDGALEAVALNNTETPDGWGIFFSFSTPISLGDGNLAFVANAAGDSLYRLMNGRLSLVVNQHTPEIPGGKGEFGSIDDLVSLGGGVIGFRGAGYLQEGIYYAVNTGSITIVKETEPDGIFGYFEFIGEDLTPMCALHYASLMDGESADCDLVPGQYTFNETVTPGFTLTSIDCVGSSSFTTTATGVIIDLEANDNIVCTFTNTRTDDLSLYVSITGTGSGSVTSSPEGINCPGDCFGEYSPGTVVSLTAIPGPDSSFSGWEGDCSGDGPVMTVTMSDFKFCTAIFTRDKFSLNVTKIGTGTGTVTSTPAGIDCGEDCTEVYMVDTVVSLTPVPAGGSSFAGWTGNPDCSDGAATMDSDKTCTAIFNLDSPPPPPHSDSADISVTKSAGPDPVDVGGELVYSISVQNQGPDEAPGASVVDILSPGLTFVSASEGCTLSGSTVTCDLGDMSSGETINKTIVVIPTQTGTITNTATANSAAFDPNPNNNTSTVSTQTDGGGDDTDSLILVPGSESVVTGEGGAVSILVEISNPDLAQTNSHASTRQTANGVVFTADLPGGFTLNTLTASQGVCDPDAAECLIGDIPAGGAATVELDATAPQQNGVYIVSFFVTTSTGQTFTGNVEVVVEKHGGNDDNGGSGGCSLAADGGNTPASLALYLLIPALMLFRRSLRRAR